VKLADALDVSMDELVDRKWPKAGRRAPGRTAGEKGGEG
jgi:hypothetical protein